MTTISLFFTNKGFFGDVARLFKDHCDAETKSQRYRDSRESFRLEEHVIKFDSSAKEKAKNVDVIISRGFTFDFLQSHIRDTPIVEIPVSGHDIIRCLAKAKSEFGAKKVAFFGPESQLRGVDELAAIIGVKIKVCVRRQPGDQEPMIREAISEGCNVIIGGVDSIAASEAMGLPTLPLRSGKEALWQAFTEAKNVARISVQERAKAESFRSIIDHTPQGILELDISNNIILCNTAAKIFLDENDKILGKNINDVITNPASLRLFDQPEENVSHIIRHRKCLFAANLIPVKINKKHTSTVVILQDTGTVQKTELSIRKIIAERGFVAKYSFDDIIGKSPAVQNARNMAMKFANAGYDILLLGASGTGKELFAQSIHTHSPRHKGPFVAVNCAAIQPQLLESILFGYSKGAFTGASKEGKAGLFEEAHNGTIFLDEIAEISPDLQSKLLRVIQEREVMRLGDNKIIPVDIRIISATNKDLLERMNKGFFREDLFYRLDVLTIKLPTLNERTEDIPILADTLVQVYAKKHGRSEMTLTPAAQELLCKTYWPGNVRQLSNICARAVVLTDKKNIDVEDIIPLISTFSPVISSSAKDACTDLVDPLIRPRITTPQYIKEALEKASYNRTEAARLLGISRTTLWKKMRESK